MSGPSLPRPLLSAALERIAQHILTRFRSEPGAGAYPEAAVDRTSGEGRTALQHVLWGSHRFRYLTLEKIRVAADTEALQVVMVSDPDYPAPIFGLQVVTHAGPIVWAVVDLSPVRPDGTLDEHYEQALAGLPPLDFQKLRPLPAWGRIFSRHYLAVHPQNDAEREQFTERALRLFDLHCELAAGPRPGTPVDMPQAWDQYRTAILAGEQRRRILERDFAPDWLARYAVTALFPPLSATSSLPGNR
jgi:phycocyanobilin:ferredoxin oxidoreductase